MDPSELRVSEAPEPELRPGALLVDVKAAGCNFFDILMVQGRYQQKPPFPFIPGAEIAGVVRAVGDGVRGFAPGDRVLAGPGLGAFAERALVAARDAHELPSAMSFAEGAALPTIYPTSYAGLVFRARLAQGETLLVHAAAGGVGSAAVQIGRALGARVIATASGEEKLKIAREAGADVAIDYTREDWVARVLAETWGRGADVIYDSVGGDVFDKSLKCIAWNGRLLVIGFAGGEIPSVKANRILLKNIAVVGLHWGAYAKFEPERIPETYRALFDMAEKGEIRPLIYREYPLAEVAAALAALGSRQSWGKVILAP
ncbi:MAG: NADPH:quinone oxidoreductase family protein [Deltaproteobacteria bacterium]|nr:NADPH:quinone oxidoreductase family protein [Deltaproteobacteria bacterium]